MNRQRFLRRILAGALGMVALPRLGRIPALVESTPPTLYAAGDVGVWSTSDTVFVRFDTVTGRAIVEHVDACGNRTNVPQPLLNEVGI